jgi:predicted lipoprotein with Yx(FWY)xxD motif
MHRTMHSRTGRLGWGAAMVAVVIAAAACGGGTSSTDKTATASAGAPPSSAAPTKAAATSAATSAASTPAAAATTAAGAAAKATINIATTGTKRFVDSAGMSLYVFMKDTANSGKSACVNGCAVAWPPATVPAGTTPTPGDGVDGLGVITRDDGTMQVTYDGLPLYRYAPDKAPGDENGKAVANWALATP